MGYGLYFKVQCRAIVTLFSPYGWIPDEDVLRTWQESIHHPSQVIHHQRQAEKKSQAGWEPSSVWGALCSECATGCSAQHVLQRASCRALQWLVQHVQCPRVEVIDWEKQKIGRGYRISINVITSVERPGAIWIQGARNGSLSLLFIGLSLLDYASFLVFVLFNASFDLTRWKEKMFDVRGGLS